MTPPSTAARLAQQAARMDAAMSSAITHLTAAVPALDADTAKAALEAAVPIPVHLPP